ncbi:MAG: flagellar M-ring protein FliF [Calditrichaeota bacterium]|nr:MAG: flagellar M-ring protein FliF [Calditrichota bacterium]
MNDFLARFRYQVAQMFSRLSMQQKMLLILFTVGILTTVIVLFVWATSTPLEPLFTDLSGKDAADILEKLKERGIEYKLSDGGHTILVPSNRVYDLRLEFAREGLPESGSVGYEIFDKQELGVTEFRQQIAYKRALEGELARTIRSIDVVDRASVFIVIPKERLFEKDQQVPTASVQLKLKRSTPPPPMTIEAIAHLVASSVEGLTPENVTITDTRGRILSQNHNASSQLALSNTQIEFRRKIEQDLAEKAQKVLEMHVGPGNAIVQVTAELNWAQVEKTIQDVNPDRSVTVSEEISEESTPIENSTSLSKSSNTITNYENAKTIQKIVEEVGNIERLSVAVLINNKKEVVEDAEGNQQVRFVPRDPAELQQLEALVKTAVGFQEERNDQFSIVNMEFSPENWEEDLDKPDTPLGDYPELIQKILIFLIILAAIFIMRSIFNYLKERNEELEKQIQQMGGIMIPQSTTTAPAMATTTAPVATKGERRAAAKETPQPAQPQPKPQAIAQQPYQEEVEEEEEEYEEDLDDLAEAEVIKANEFFKSKSKSRVNIQINHYVKQNPEAASKLLKVWLLEGEEDENKPRKP